MLAISGVRSTSALQRRRQLDHRLPSVPDAVQEMTAPRRGVCTPGGRGVWRSRAPAAAGPGVRPFRAPARPSTGFPPPRTPSPPATPPDPYPPTRPGTGRAVETDDAPPAHAAGPQRQRDGMRHRGQPSRFAAAPDRSRCQYACSALSRQVRTATARRAGGAGRQRHRPGRPTVPPGPDRSRGGPGDVEEQRPARRLQQRVHSVTQRPSAHRHGLLPRNERQQHNAGIADRAPSLASIAEMLLPGRFKVSSTNAGPCDRTCSAAPKPRTGSSPASSSSRPHQTYPDRSRFPTPRTRCAARTGRGRQDHAPPAE